ncbi:MAG: hypothetical protein AB7O96_15680 [Pseudobdellovibrionaceae bacterium]
MNLKIAIFVTVLSVLTLSFHSMANSPLTDEQIAAYSKSSKVQKMIAIAVGNSSSRTGYCLPAVIKAMSGSGLAPQWWASSPQDHNWYAKYSIPHLEAKERGFVNLLDTNPNLTPEDAPEGAILVYSGRNPRSTCLDLSPKATEEQDCGHIEIRTANGYVSDFVSSSPISDMANSTYKIIGIMVKAL